MQIEGTYRVFMKTPLGERNGTLTLARQGDGFTGSLRAMGGTSPVSVTADGDSITFSGVLRVAFYRFDYTAHGRIQDGRLQAVASTRSGKFTITGERI